jgi:DNA (cytosine-5)-methyltransferase 1
MSISKGKSTAKKPQTSRYTKVKAKLEASIFAKNKILVDTKDVEFDGNTYNTVDLFSGCGGLSKGFEDAGFRSILGVEIDPDAAATYDANFKDAKVWSGDIHDLTDEEALRAIDGQEVHVLVGGFPCQGFSVAGVRDPEDERNQLFKQMVRFTKLFNPMFVVGENVPGIVTMDDGRFMDEIFHSFNDIGYTITARVLESADFGVAQYRPRTFFIANRFGVANPYPIELLDPDNHVTIEHSIDNLKDAPRDASTNHEWTAHRKSTIERIEKVAPGHSLYESYADAFKRQYRGRPSMTIKENHGGTHIHHELDRCISAREMARLQSFPDDFFFQGTMKRAMFQIGNAVPPLLSRHVALALRPTLAEFIDEN